MTASATPFSDMPPEAPLAMPLQRFDRTFRDDAAPPPRRAQPWGSRMTVFGGALAVAGALAAIFFDWFKDAGFVASETVLVGLIAFSSFWIALGVFTALLGLGALPKRRKPDHVPNISVALVMPVYNEDPRGVFKRLRAMRAAVSALPKGHRFAFFVLSDTTDESVACAERMAYQSIATMPGQVPVHYRRRAANTDRKTGNIRDWVSRWGGDWDAFVTLDADSVMEADTLAALADGLAIDPRAGLIQTVPHLVGARSVFARVNQFSNNIYGTLLARGTQIYSRAEGNYWGHNAIIRTRAFAACAGLPHIASRHRALGGTIKSHDFVEAALLRRAGWAVRLRANMVGSFEAAPQTLVDHVLRDRRWCQGNLQHLALLHLPGLATASRFHMAQGAMAYMNSLVWFALLVVFAIMGGEQTVLTYFSPDNPLFPKWPQMGFVSHWAVLMIMAGLLLFPKLLAFTWHILTRGVPYGHSFASFTGSLLAEIVVSVIVAPVLMVQHVVAVTRTFAGLDAGWVPQDRDGVRRPLSVLARFHWLETVVGAALVVGIATGFVSWWLSPIAASLLMAVPISALTALRIETTRVMATPEDLTPSPLLEQSGYPSPVLRPGGPLTLIGPQIEPASTM